MLWTEGAPQRLALVEETGSLTYAELAERVERVASALPSDARPVGILLPLGSAALIALLASLKAGLRAAPLAWEEPFARLATRVNQLDGTLVCDSRTRGLAGRLVNDGRIVDLDRLPPARPRADSGDPGVLLQTSGSQGAPRAVSYRLESLLKLRDARLAREPIGPEDRLTLFSSPTVLGFLSTALASLAAGACLYPLDLRRYPLEQLPAWLREQAITVYFSVPSVARALGPGSLPGLRLLQLSGEPLDARDLHQLAARLDRDAIVRNGLSTTETGAIARLELSAEEARRWEGPVPCGSLLPGVEIWLGENEELTVSTPWMADGYYGHAPFGGRFQTGDRARWSERGLLSLGRLDRQVKVRGHRVELAEVEAALRRLPGVTAAVVKAEQGGLTAYLEMPRPEEPQRLRQQLARLLPAACWPDRWQVSGQLPRLASGKISSPETPFLRLWREVLRAPEAGPDDDFFALGGTSLVAAQLLQRLSTLNPALATASPDALLAAPTPRLLERYSGPARVCTRLDGTARLGRLYCFPGADGRIELFRGLARELAGDLEVLGLTSPWELEDALERYADSVAEGPVFLLGFSLGGFLALELARRLGTRGRTVQAVFLLDSFLLHDGRGVRPWETLRKAWTLLGLILRLRPGAWPRFVREQWRELQARLQDVQHPGTDWWHAQDWRPFRYPGRTVLLKAAHGRARGGQEHGWTAWLPRLEVRTVPGYHGGTLLRSPCVEQVAREIRRL